MVTLEGTVGHQELSLKATPKCTKGGLQRGSSRGRRTAAVGQTLKVRRKTTGFKEDAPDFSHDPPKFRHGVFQRRRVATSRGGALVFFCPKKPRGLVRLAAENVTRYGTIRGELD